MIFVTGDTHGHHDIKKLNSKKFPQGRELTKSDVLIITGDFGLIFHPRRSHQEQYWLDWLESKPWTTLFLDGNHDNHDRLSELPTTTLYGNTVGKVSESIYHLKRGNVYTIENQTFFVFGGANSIDKHRRTEGIDWWRAEEPTYAETKHGLNSLEEYHYDFDYVLTHDAPTFVRVNLFSHHNIEENSPTVRFLDEIFPRLSFKHHYFGHHHQDITVHGVHTCSYRKIHQLTD